jgi:hypothetical protein
MRFVRRNECVLRLRSTGAIILARLRHPLDQTKACLISPLKPIVSQVLLGPMSNNGFDECDLQIEWPETYRTIPPPARFQRKKFRAAPVHRDKRQRT